MGEDATKLHVGRLPQDIEEDEVLMIFGTYGVVREVVLMKGDSSGDYRRTAFVRYERPQGAQAAVQVLDNVYRFREEAPEPIRVQFARSQGPVRGRDGERRIVCTRLSYYEDFPPDSPRRDESRDRGDKDRDRGSSRDRERDRGGGRGSDRGYRDRDDRSRSRDRGHYRDDRKDHDRGHPRGNADHDRRRGHDRGDQDRGHGRGDDSHRDRDQGSRDAGRGEGLRDDHRSDGSRRDGGAGSRSSSDGPKKLYVCNLPDDIDAEALDMVFTTYGKVDDIKVMTGRSRSGQAAAFVVFASHQGAMTAIAAMEQGYEIRPGDGNIQVQFARSELERVRGADRGRRD
eukprot:TRINITY_DN12839_c0_g1_i1.p1 TRINITY_DN12839_c0_g1~~TRINITY_DN12839_c0_g1_i1.p1  ORF type:complete len:343 (+),score=49.01 TRINITY_DN12839_c0_g1_i1:120-1148(+)